MPADDSLIRYFLIKKVNNKWIVRFQSSDNFINWMGYTFNSYCATKYWVKTYLLSEANVVGRNYCIYKSCPIDKIPSHLI